MRDGTGSRPLLRVRLRIPNALLLARLTNIPKHTAVVAGRIPGQSRQPFCPGFAPYFEKQEDEVGSPNWRSTAKVNVGPSRKTVYP